MGLFGGKQEIDGEKYWSGRAVHIFSIPVANMILQLKNTELENGFSEVQESVFIQHIRAVYVCLAEIALTRSNARMDRMTAIGQSYRSRARVLAEYDELVSPLSDLYATAFASSSRDGVMAMAIAFNQALRPHQDLDATPLLRLVAHFYRELNDRLADWKRTKLSIVRQS